MKILHCGSYIPASLISRFPNSSEAGNNFQEKVITELKKYSEVEILSYVGYYVSQHQAGELSKILADNGITAVINTGGISRILNFYRYYREYIRLLKKSDAVVFYNICYMYVLIWAVNLFCKRKLVLILADYSELEEIKSCVRRLVQCVMKSCINRFEYACILSIETYKKSTIKNKLFFPGAICYADFKKFSLKNNDKVKILYSGLLNDVTGVDNLLEAITKVDNPNSQFIFTGRGELETTIKMAAKEDSRIVYKGFLDRKEYYELLNNVDIVVNPRNMNLPQNHNNFPSKIMEYLASGRLIVSTRFAGFDLFKENILSVDSNVESLIDGLQEAIKMVETDDNKAYFEKNRSKAQEYDWNIMGERLSKFIEEDNEENRNFT